MRKKINIDKNHTDVNKSDTNIQKKVINLNSDEKNPLKKKVVSGIIGDIGDILDTKDTYDTIIKNDTYDTIINNNVIYSISSYPKRDIILNIIFEGYTKIIDIQNVYSKTVEEIEYRTLQGMITRNDRETSLIKQGFVNSEGNRINITKRGINYLKSLVTQYEDKIREQRLKREQEEKDARNAATQVQIYKDIISENYSAELAVAKIKEKPLEIDFNLVMSINPELVLNFLDEGNAETHLKTIKLALSNISEEYSSVHVVFKNIPASAERKIGSLSHKDEKNLVLIKGIVVNRDNPCPHYAKIKYECPGCAQIVSMMQGGQDIKSPKKCTNCGYKGKFNKIHCDYKTIQIMKIEEYGEAIGEKSMPSQIHVVLEEPFTNNEYQSIFNPGSNVEITGIVTIQHFDKKKTKGQLVIEALNCVSDKKGIDLQITEQEEKEFRKIAKSPKYLNKLKSLFAQDVSGMDDIKESLLLQVASLNNSFDNKGERQPINILLVGDPGTGKSVIASKSQEIVPRSRKAANTSSAVGLTYAVVKNEMTGEFTLKAGALPLANGALCFIDELDKFRKEDLDTLHEALAQRRITVNKAGISGSLKCETAVLATANPKYGRFDEYEDFLKQVNISYSLLDRFGLVWIIKDDFGDDRAIKIAQMMAKKLNNELDYDPTFIAKYLSKCRKYNPSHNKEAVDYLCEWFDKTRKKAKQLIDNGEVAPYISNRTFEAIALLSYSYSKLRFSNETDVNDVKKAINLYQNCIKRAKEVSESLFGYMTSNPSISKDKVIIDKIKAIVLEESYYLNEIITHSDLEDYSPKEVKRILDEQKNKEWKYKDGKYKTIPSHLEVKL